MTRESVADCLKSEVQFIAQKPKTRYNTASIMFKKQNDATRIRLVAVMFFLVAVWIAFRLFYLQVVQHNYYVLLSSNTHELYQQLFPARGQIYFSDTRTGAEYPAAVNRTYYLVYAVPREISANNLKSTIKSVTEILGVTNEDEKNLLAEKLSKTADSYEQLAKKIPSSVINKLKQAALPGIYYRGENYRFYPEEWVGSSVLGFAKLNDQGRLVGQYGLEGYWDEKLSGKSGFLIAEKGAKGNQLPLAGKQLVKAEPGVDLLLTIDRTLEFKACERLKEGVKEFGATSGALVLMDPNTGAILAMCSEPDFDPNNYSKVSDMGAYNNKTIFIDYEPGSVFKPIAMSAALDLGLVTPHTVFTDPCTREFNGFVIHNAMNKCYGEQTMGGVLENSINTGMVWVEEKVGLDKFKDYIMRYGFGEKIGIELDKEVPGNISSLNKKGPIYAAVGSFGQGLTVTPLQLAVAYSAIANRGKLLKPYIVTETRYPNGSKQTAEPQIISTILSTRTADMLSGMLVSVVDKQGLASRLPKYFLAGKTGTAQIAGKGGYTTDTNHTFAGFAPANNSKLVLVVKLEKPNRAWAETTAGHIFKDVMQFALDYYGIPPQR